MKQNTMVYSQLMKFNLKAMITLCKLKLQSRARFQTNTLDCVGNTQVAISFGTGQ